LENDLILNTFTEKVNETAIKNKTEGECDMDFEMKETSETKPDGSTAMFIRRVSQCREETGKSEEECAKEVKKKMKSKGSENAITGADSEKIKKNTEEKPKTEEEEKEDKDKEEETDTIEVCKKEYDFLKRKIEELESVKKEKETTEKVLESFKRDFEEFKDRIMAKEARKREEKRQEKIEELSQDFNIPREKIENKSIEDLIDLEDILDTILRRDEEAQEEETFGEEEDFETMAERMKKKYFLDV